MNEIYLSSRTIFNVKYKAVELLGRAILFPKTIIVIAKEPLIAKVVMDIINESTILQNEIKEITYLGILFKNGSQITIYK